LTDYRRGIFVFGKAILSSWMLVGALVAQSQGVGTGGPGNSGSHPTVGQNPGTGGQNPGAGHNTGNSGNAHGQSKKYGSIQWITSAADAAAALLSAGTADVQFQSSLDLTNINVWLTPSLASLTPNPKSFDTITKGNTYTITLTMPNKPAHTLGGTLQLKASSDNSRTYASPLPLSIHVGGGKQADAQIAAITDSANYQQGSVAPGQLVSLFGSGIGPDALAEVEIDAHGRVPNYLAGAQVLFNGVAAPLLAASNAQVNAVVPQSVASDGTVEVVAVFDGKVSASVTLPVAAADPALFTHDGTGRGQSAALNQDGTVNGHTNPARPGSVVVLFGSGFGEWKQALPDGAIVGSSLPTPTLPVSVTIGGAAAKVLYAGGAPGLVSGVVQINVQIPAGTPAGNSIAVVVTVGGKSSTADATVAVR
jgi:uncharacterized protein (TIGR03437 family)